MNYEKINMKQKDIKELKHEIYINNNEICPLLNIKIPFDKMVLDHIHKTKDEETSIKKGSIRNAIDFRANAMEGKITNNWKRLFGSDENKHPISLSNYLRNLADYLEKGAYIKDGKYFIHPSEIPKEPNVSKRNYNKLKKLYDASDRKAKFPEYPKSKKLTKKLKELFNDFNIEPYN